MHRGDKSPHYQRMDFARVFSSKEMKNLRSLPTSSKMEDMGNKSKTDSPSNRNVDAATIEKNPKVDAQLVSDFYRLVDASKGVIRGARGANYRCRIHSAPMMCQPNLVKLEKAGVQSKRLEHWQRSVRQAI